MEGSDGVVKVLYLGRRPGTKELVEHLDAASHFAVTTAESVSEARDLLDTESFDCVVGDANDGLDVVESIRELDSDVPYVFVAEEGADVARAALSRGATAYLERRSDRDQRAVLVTRVENAVARRRADAESREESADPTDRERIVEELHESETYLRKLYRTASNAELDFEQKCRRLLELGRDRLGVDIGFVSRIEDGSFEVVHAVGSHELLDAGSSAPLTETYCRKAIDEEGLLAVHDAASEGWAEDLAYQTYGLGCYVGAKVRVNGDLYGTICFADQDPRDRTFTESQQVYVELISQWLGYELEQMADERRLRQQNDRLDEFASVVSHDLRNPLNIAEIYLDMAEESGDPEDFEQVRTAHDRMDGLITNLLTLARQDEALTDVGDHDLSAVVPEAWGSVETGDATYELDDPPTVEADGERLRQLLENLFRNAVEHASGSGGVVRVGSLGNDDSEDSVEGFYVADDGPGIPEDDRERIFDHGFSTSDEGTGLGLVIVRRITEAHDWQVSVGESELGGARFEIRTD